MFQKILLFTMQVPEEIKERFSEFPPIFNNCEIAIAYRWWERRELRDGELAPWRVKIYISPETIFDDGVDYHKHWNCDRVQRKTNLWLVHEGNVSRWTVGGSWQWRISRERWCIKIKRKLWISFTKEKNLPNHVTNKELREQIFVVEKQKRKLYSTYQCKSVWPCILMPNSGWYSCGNL